MKSNFTFIDLFAGCGGLSEVFFKKEILFTLENIVKKKVDKKEWDCIYEARRECKKMGWHNINREVQL